VERVAKENFLREAGAGPLRAGGAALRRKLETWKNSILIVRTITTMGAIR